MLKVEGLTKNFGELCAVDRCSFEVGQGTIQGLIGPNGSGKTTVFNLITGFLQVTSGRITFKGTGDHRAGRHTIIPDAGIARTFQMVRVFRRMTVLENLLRGRRSRRRAAAGWAPCRRRRCAGRNASTSTGPGIC